VTTQPQETTTPKAEKKAVVIRFPVPLHDRVADHADQMSMEMGGANVSFTAAVLALIQDGLKKPSRK
jgi:hypothetical protein